MIYRKLLLKNDLGAPLASLTVRFDEGRAALPRGLSVTRWRAGEQTREGPAEHTLLLPSGTEDLTLVGVYRGESVFATSRPDGDELYLKWLLSRPAETAREEAPPVREERADLAERCDLVVEEAENPPAETPYERVKRLVEEGDPFDRFTALMPAARWAIYRGEECPCLVGLREEEGVARVLYGVAGSRAYPPDEMTLWTFYPTSEDGEEGYFLTEGEDLPF